MPRQIEQPTWAHSAELRELRGAQSVETAARRVRVTRQTWAAWEKGTSIPQHDNLRAIVEEWNCPPELVGYEPPRGWELVPSEWIRSNQEQVMAALKQIQNDLVVIRSKR